MTSAKQTDDSVAHLRELGFDPTAPPAQATAKLESLRSGANQVAIARALGQIAAPEAVALLAEMEMGSTGELRREIRRSLYRLRQHGFELPARETSLSAAVPAATESGLGGMMSVADAEGARIVWITKARPGGGLKRLWALISESEGLLAITAESLSRKELRSSRAELEQRAGARLVEADWTLVDFIMCEAYRHTAGNRRARVGNFLTLRTEMVAASPPSVDFRHPIYGEFAAEAMGEPPPELMKEPDIAAYKLPPDAIRPFADEATQLQQSTLVLNRMVQEERVNAVLDRAIDQLLTGELSYRLRRRLEDTGYYFARVGKRLQAGWATAAAAKIRDGAELKRSPFFRLFMRGQMGAMLAEHQEKLQEQPRLIMTPAEVMRARTAAQARMARRGRLP